MILVWIYCFEDIRIYIWLCFIGWGCVAKAVILFFSSGSNVLLFQRPDVGGPAGRDINWFMGDL